MSLLLADCVAKRFCASECARLIQDQGSRYNVDSRIHSLRFDCCVFLFYSFSAVTFATKSAQRVVSLRFQCLDAIGVKADIARAWRACRSEAIDPGCSLIPGLGSSSPRTSLPGPGFSPQ